MSTRATYEFFTDKKGPRTCVYIHHDGYPEGAAAYFYNTFLNPSKGNLATQFIRCNEGAELTKSHKAHGDTEYQYSVEGNHLGDDIHAFDVRRNKFCFTGPLWKFINENSKLIPNFKPIKLVQLQYNQAYLNEGMAENMLKLPLHHLQCWEGRHEGSANWNSCVQEIRVLVQAFPDLYSPDLAKYGITTEQAA